MIYYFSHASMKIEIKYQFIDRGQNYSYIILCHHFKILFDLTRIKFLNTVQSFTNTIRLRENYPRNGIC